MRQHPQVTSEVWQLSDAGQQPLRRTTHHFRCLTMYIGLPVCMDQLHKKQAHRVHRKFQGGRWDLVGVTFFLSQCLQSQDCVHKCSVSRSMLLCDFHSAPRCPAKSCATEFRHGQCPTSWYVLFTQVLPYKHVVPQLSELHGERARSSLGEHVSGNLKSGKVHTHMVWRRWCGSNAHETCSDEPMFHVPGTQHTRRWISQFWRPESMCRHCKN